MLVLYEILHVSLSRLWFLFLAPLATLVPPLTMVIFFLICPLRVLLLCWFVSLFLSGPMIRSLMLLRRLLPLQLLPLLICFHGPAPLILFLVLFATAMPLWLLRLLLYLLFLFQEVLSLCKLSLKIFLLSFLGKLLLPLLFLAETVSAFLLLLLLDLALLS